MVEITDTTKDHTEKAESHDAPKTHTAKKTAHKKKHTTKEATHTSTHKPQQNDTVTLQFSKSSLVTVVTTVIATLAIILFIWIIYSAISTDSGSVGTTTTGSGNGLVAGDGVVTIIEYSDFECPFCSRVQPTLEQVKQTYGDKVVIDYRHFPLSFHQNAQKAAEASECARDQDEFWAYHDLLFANQNALGISALKGYAATLGLDTETFNSCLDSGEKAAIVASDMAEGRAFGVTGTPGFNIEGELLVGAQPFSEFKRVIDSKLAAGGSATGSNTGSEPVDITDPTENDPQVTLTVITDESCAVCDHQQIIDVTQSEIFPTAVATQVAADSAEGQALIEKYAITGVPAYIFSSNIVDAANYADIAQALVQVDDGYIIAQGAAGPFRLLTEVDISGQPIKGSADAPVTIIEFSDFECPFCKKFVDEAYTQLVDTYVDSGDVKIVYMHLPLTSIHANAQKAAEASECANDQDKFWEYHDTLFENQNSLGISALKGYASDLGLDQVTFDECLDSGKYTQLVQDETALAQSLGMSGTPGFLVNGIQLVGAQPFTAFEQIIEPMLE